MKRRQGPKQENRITDKVERSKYQKIGSPHSSINHWSVIIVPETGLTLQDKEAILVPQKLGKVRGKMATVNDLKRPVSEQSYFSCLLSPLPVTTCLTSLQ